MAASAVEAEGKTRVEVLVDIEKTPKHFVSGGEWNCVRPVARLYGPFRVPAQYLYSCLHFYLPQSACLSSFVPVFLDP